MRTDLRKHLGLKGVARLPELALLVAHPRCGLKVLGLDRSLLGLAYLFDLRSASPLGGQDLGAEGVDFALELVGVNSKAV